MGPNKKELEMQTPSPRPLARMTFTALLFLATAIPAIAGPHGSTGTSARGDQGRQALTDLMRKQPYLIWPGDNTEMEVLWQLTGAATSTIEWGVDTTYALGSVPTAEYGADHQHAYTIGGLAPGQKYCYRVTAGGPPYTGTFNAAPPSDATSLKFVAYGDTRSNPGTHDQVTQAIVSLYTSDPAYQTLAPVGGDLVSTGESETSWTNEFFSPSYPNIRRLVANVAYQSCMGNHEGAGTLFKKYLPYPFVSSRYWSYDYGPAHFTVMDQFTSYGAGSPQLQWITNDLAASNKPWKFIVLHEPGWSAGGGHENNTLVQTYIQPLCIQYGVCMVLGGHNHYYARAEVSGIEHITTGGGGAPLYTPDPGYPYIVTTARANHYCRIAIDGSTLTFEALTPAGQVLDRFTLHNNSSVDRPRLSVAGIGAAQPNPFSGRTVIHWSAPAGGAGRLQVLDVYGRRVRWFAGTVEGTNATMWDGTDETGRPVPSGVYYYRLAPAGAEGSGRVLLIR